MKIKQYIIKLIVVCGFLCAVSCTDDFTDVNIDPNAFNEAPIEAAFTGVVKRSYDLLGEMNGDNFLHYASYNGGVGGQNPRYGFTQSHTAGLWRDMFVRVLKNNQQIIDDHNEDPAFSNRIHMAKIWKSYMYSIAVSFWGPIPMSEAFGEETSVAYDSEEQIYTEILRLLGDAVTGLENGGDTFAVDFIFNRDVEMWRKFANTLRLKIGLRLSHGFPALAQAAVQASMSNESNLVGSNSENISMKGGLTEENWNWHYNKYIFGTPNLDTFPYVNHSYLLHLKTYDDPRMDKIVQPAGAPLLIEDMVYASGSTTEMIAVRYGIPKYGKPLSTNGTIDAWDLQNNDNIMNGVDGGNYSLPSEELFMQPDNIYYIITYAETSLMKAEAAVRGWGGSKTAQEYYEEGIDASFDQYEVGSAAAYKEQDGIKWGTAAVGDRDLYGITTSGITADPMDKIIRQRWLAMYWQGHDAWCMLKRTRGIILPPHLSPDGSGGDITEDWAEIPERMRYAASEESINGEGYQLGLSYLGGSDSTLTPLQMNAPGGTINWAALPAEFNQEFANHWYGDSEDDLIAAGIPYEKL